jgi:hypothetical protein
VPIRTPLEAGGGCFKAVAGSKKTKPGRDIGVICGRIVRDSDTSAT